MDELVILDFETTGLSPAYARVIEVGAIIVKGTQIVGTLSQLMDPGGPIPRFITQITGITNQMVKGQPTPERFMPQLRQFIGNRPVLAHNASFDEKFLMCEMENIGHSIENKFLCTLKLSRRLIPGSPDYKLTTLASHLKLKFPKEHQAHRALNDVIMTFHVWLYLKKTVSDYLNIHPSLELFLKLANQPKTKVTSFLDSFKNAPTWQNRD